MDNFFHVKTFSFTCFSCLCAGRISLFSELGVTFSYPLFFQNLPFMVIHRMKGEKNLVGNNDSSSHKMVLAYLVNIDIMTEIQEQVLDLSSVLRDQFDIHIIILFSDKNTVEPSCEIFSQNNIKSLRVFCKNGFSFKTCRLIKEMLSDLGVALVHTYGVKADFFGRFLRGEKIFWVSSVHSLEEYRRLSRVKKISYHFCMRSCDWIVFFTHHVQNEIRKNIYHDRMSVINPGVRGLSRSDSCASGNILFAGPSTVQTLNRGDSSKFFTAGGDNLVESFAQADIFVYAYQDSMLRKSFLLAMSCACAIVAVRTSVVLECVADGDSALLVHPGDVYELSLSLKKLVNDVAWRQKLGARAKDIYLEKFTLEKMVSKYRSLYQMFL